MVVVEHIPESVVDHQVHHLRVEHSGSPAGLRHNVRRRGHVLRSAGNDDICIAGLDDLCRQLHGPETGSADLINRHGRHFHRKPCIQGHLAGHILAQAALEHITHDDFVHLLRLHTGSLQCFPDTYRTQRSGRYILQRTTEGSDCGSGCSYDNNVFHNSFLQIWFFCLRSRRCGFASMR